VAGQPALIRRLAGCPQRLLRMRAAGYEVLAADAALTARTVERSCNAVEAGCE
jgi:hypothetical protein